MQPSPRMVASSNGRDATEQRPVVVCGAGAAGIAAALSAARRGANVWLIEPCQRVGGTVTRALIHTLGGFFDAGGELVNRGLAQEIVETLARSDPSTTKRKIGRTWVLSAAPELYLDVVERMLAAESRIRLQTRSRVTKAECQKGRIVRLEGFVGQKEFCVIPRAVVDATGTGALVRQIDPELMEDDTRAAAGGLIFRLHGVAPDAIEFPKGLAAVRALHEAAEKGRIPETCRHAWLDRGVAKGEVYVKLFIPLRAEPAGQNLPGQPAQHPEHVQKIVVEFLRQLPGFESARVNKTGEIGVRDGGRLRGEYQLTGADVRQAGRFDDAVCQACWPIEYWDAEKGLTLEYLPMDRSYEIPLRSLKVPGVHNAWVAGKCLSADREAQASARVVGCCWAMGEAAGAAAALA